LDVDDVLVVGVFWGPWVERKGNWPMDGTK